MVTLEVRPALPFASREEPLLSHFSRPPTIDVSAEIAAALSSCTALPVARARPVLEDFPYASAAPGVPAAVAYHEDLTRRLLVSHFSFLGPSAGCLPAGAALPLSVLWWTEVTSPGSGRRAALGDQLTISRPTNFCPYQKGWLVRPTNQRGWLVGAILHSPSLPFHRDEWRVMNCQSIKGCPNPAGVLSACSVEVRTPQPFPELLREQLQAPFSLMQLFGSNLLSCGVPAAAFSCGGARWCNLWRGRHEQSASHPIMSAAFGRVCPHRPALKPRSAAGGKRYLYEQPLHLLLAALPSAAARSAAGSRAASLSLLQLLCFCTHVRWRIPPTSRYEANSLLQPREPLPYPLEGLLQYLEVVGWSGRPSNCARRPTNARDPSHGWLVWKTHQRARPYDGLLRHGASSLAILEHRVRQ